MVDDVGGQLDGDHPRDRQRRSSGRSMVSGDEPSAFVLGHAPPPLHAVSMPCPTVLMPRPSLPHHPGELVEFFAALGRTDRDDAVAGFQNEARLRPIGPSSPALHGQDEHARLGLDREVLDRSSVGRRPGADHGLVPDLVGLDESRGDHGMELFTRLRPGGSSRVPSRRSSRSLHARWSSPRRSSGLRASCALRSTHDSSSSWIASERASRLLTSAARAWSLNRSAEYASPTATSAEFFISTSRSTARSRSDSGIVGRSVEARAAAGSAHQLAYKGDAVLGPLRAGRRSSATT